MEKLSIDTTYVHIYVVIYLVKNVSFTEFLLKKSGLSTFRKKIYFVHKLESWYLLSTNSGLTAMKGFVS